MAGAAGVEIVDADVDESAPSGECVCCCHVAALHNGEDALWTVTAGTIRVRGQKVLYAQVICGGGGLPTGGHRPPGVLSQSSFSFPSRLPAKPDIHTTPAGTALSNPTGPFEGPFSFPFVPTQRRIP
jgi:hypothetical protein